MDDTSTITVDACDFCGSTATETLVAGARDRLHRLPGEFSLVRCGSCDLVRLSPRPSPEKLGDYYPGSDYYAYQEPEALPGDERAGAGVRDKARDVVLRDMGYPGPGARRPTDRLLRRLLPSPLRRRATFGHRAFPDWVSDGRALDIGCGAGVLLNDLKRTGWVAEGVDVSEASAATVEKMFGIKVHVGTVEDAAFEPGTFDFINMSHSIEHVDSPASTLARVHELLRPGGRVFIETPNIDSLGFRLCGRFWFPLETPRHLWMFSAKTLSRSLEKAGLTVDEKIGIDALDTPAWFFTYRREDAGATPVPEDQRPSLGPGEGPRAAVMRSLISGSRMAGPSLAETIGIWAGKAS